MSILFQTSVQTVQRRNLVHLSGVQARSIQETLRTADAVAESVSTRLHLLRHIRTINRREDTDGTVPAIREIAEMIVTGDVAGVALFALNGERIAQAGRLGDSKDLHIVLDHARQLHWDNVPVLQRRLTLLADEETVGSATVAIRLPGIATILGDAYGLAPSAETLLCAAHDSKTMMCLPHRFSASMTLRDRIRDGRPLPVAQALDGITGTLDSIDYRGRAVLASAMPIPPFSLALLSKIDRSDLAAPLAGKAVWLAGIVFLLTTGLILLHHLGPSRLTRNDRMVTGGGELA